MCGFPQIVKQFFIVVLIQVFALSVYAQRSDSVLVHRADSLLQTSPNDTLLYQTYLSLVHFHLRSNASKTAYFANRAIVLGDSLDNELGFGIGKMGLALHLIIQGEYDTGLLNAFEAESIFKKIRHNKYLAMTYSYIGMAYSFRGFNNEALRYYVHSDSLMKISGSPLEQAQIEANIGILYGLEGDNEATIRYFKKAMEVISKQGTDFQIALGLHNIGVSFGHINEPDSALYYLNNALDIRKSINSSYGIAASSFSIGEIYYNLGDYEFALSFLETAEELQTELDDKSNLPPTLLKMGQVLLELHQFKKAYSYASKALEIAESTGNMSQRAEATLFLSEFELQLGNHKQAYEFLRDYQILNDSLVQQNRNHAFEEMRARYEAEEMEHQIETLENTQRIQESELARANILRHSLLAGAFGLLIFLVLLYQRYRTVKEHDRILGQKNRELEALSIEKSEYLNIAAHDLKTPLSSITGLADLISISELESEKTREYADYIKISAFRMLDLIKQFLDVNAIESGKKMTDSKPIDLIPPLEEVISHYAYRADWKKIKLDTEFSSNELNAVADTTLFKEVMENIISNAVKYTFEGGQVTVLTRQDDKFAYISVSDSGPGLSEEDQKKLFDKFTRLTPVPTGNEGSTGLGLYIADRMIRAMKGSIRCESKLGEGSTFTVSLPLA